MWRTVPIHRREVPGDRRADAPPALPPNFARDDLQSPADGSGPLFHRRFAVRIAGADRSPEELIANMREDLDAFAPSEFASFHRTAGDGPLAAGQEYLVRMPGPWDGPVRVVEAGESSFRLATLAGHLEAGQIEFRASRDGELEVTIESWARSGDRLSNLLYTRMRMAKEVQLHMWVSFLERAVAHSGGRRSGPMVIETRRVDDHGVADRAAPMSRRTRRALDRLHDSPLNFEPTELVERPDLWTHDERAQPLPAEPPGPPQPGCSWETARRLMRGYEFAEPSIVRAHYDPELPLKRRDMVLEVRFHGLAIHAGCRITDVFGGTGLQDGRLVHCWGWSYATLRGHFEQGEMSWEVVKWADTGEVAFRLGARSRPSRDPNAIVRLGFRLFGRREQLRFYDSTCARMLRLTEEALRHDRSADAIRRTSGGALTSGIDSGQLP
jgi:uncharacterized protein (UPF0548 family)